MKPPPGTQLHRTSGWVRATTVRMACLILLAAVCFLSTTAKAQGCAQCLDSTRATPPQVQAAYRHAIFLLGGAGITLFLTGTLLLREKR